MSALKYLSCILLLLLTSRIYSQIPDTIWTKTFGGALADVGNSVKQTNDGGFIVAGTTSSFGAGGQDIYLIKTDENGDTLWTKTFGGIGNDRASNVVQTNDDGYAVFGTTNSFGNGGDDFLLWKTDSFGNTEWFKTYGTNSDEVEKEGIETSDKGYLLVGNINEAFHKSLIIKIDSSGNETWSRIIVNYQCPTLVYSVTQTVDSGYAVCGIWYYWIPGDYIYKSYLYKFSSSGDSLLTKTYDFTIREIPFVIRNTYDGNLILGGITGTYDQQSRLLKVTQDGDIIWTKEIDGSQDPDYLNSLEQDFDSGFVFTIVCNGNPPFGADFGLIKCDINGDFLWEKRIGGSQYDFARSVSVTNDSGYIVTGETKSFGSGDNDVWLMKFKYPPIVNVRIDFFPPVDTAWVFGGCTGPDLISRNLVSTPERDSITIEPGPSSTLFYYDSTGNTVPVEKFYFIVEDSLNQYDYELWFHPKSWPPFDPILIPSDSVFYFQQNSFNLQLLVKQNGVSIDSLSQSFRADWGLSVEDSLNQYLPNDYKLYQNFPNPYNISTYIKYYVPDQVSINNEFVTLIVYDIMGNEVATLVNERKPKGEYIVPFDGTNLSSGIYFYQLKVGNYLETRKMVFLK